MKAPQICIEGCSYQLSFIGPGSAGFGPTFRGCVDTEGTNQFRELNTGGADGLASSSALGELHLSGANGAISTTYPTGMQIINDMQGMGPWPRRRTHSASPRSTPTGGGRPSSLSGGTVTAVKVSALMGGAAAPTLTQVWTGALTSPITIRIPPGGWWGDRRLGQADRRLDPGLGGAPVQPYRTARPHDPAECERCGPERPGHQLCQHDGCNQLAEAQHRRHATAEEYDALPEALRPIDGIAHQAVYTCYDHEATRSAPTCTTTPRRTPHSA